MGYGSAGLFAGIGRALTGVGQSIGDKRRYEEETSRKEREDEERRNRQRMLDDIALSEIGGGRGPAPTVTETIPTRGAPRRPDFEKGPLFPEPGSTEMGVKAPASYMPMPSFEEAAPPTVETTDTDRYRTGGEGENAYYFERGDYRRKSLAGEEADRASEERAAFMGRTTPAIGRIAAGAGTGGDISALLAEGISDPTRLAPAEAEAAFDPATDPALRRLEARAKDPVKYGEDVGDDPLPARMRPSFEETMRSVEADPRFTNRSYEDKIRIVNEMVAGTYEYKAKPGEADASSESGGGWNPLKAILGGFRKSIGSISEGVPATFGEVVTPRDWGTGAHVGPEK